MSYILDALKKSEQERGHGHIPSVQTVHTSSLNYSHKKSYWPYILIAVVTLNLIVITYFFMNKNETATVTAARTDTSIENIQSTSDTPSPVITTTPRDNSIQQTIAAPVISTSTDNYADTTDSGLTRQISVPGASSANNEAIDPYSQSAVQSATQSVNQPAATASYSAQSYKPQSYDTEPRDAETINTEIIDYHDLPEPTKRQLPSIVVSAHVYSDNPLQRSIVVNNKFLEEGERILDDLILQEITPDGAIMNYRGITFRYEIVSSWQ